MKNRLLVALTFGVFLSTSGAHAADPYVDRSFDWSGLYGGLYAGYGFGDADANGDDGAFDEAGPETFSQHPDGFLGGVTLGHNWQSGNFVFGLEGELGYNAAEDSKFVTTNPPDNFGEVEYGLYGTLAARFGIASNDLLLYGKLGGAVTEIDHRAGDLVGTTTVIDDDDVSEADKAALGFVVGAGVEYAVTQNWSMKLEYNYMAFEDISASNIDGDSFSFENDIHVAKFGFNMHF
jgi:outer membrane immunogenic protein